MTALKGKAVEAFVRAGGQDEKGRRTPAALIYGPDGGLVRERGDALARSVVDDLNDPFNYIELADADLKAETGRLADEAAALSFAGGERVVRLRTSGEAGAKAAAALVTALEKGLKTNGLVIVEAGDLAKSSALRKIFEKSKAVVALPCYADGPGEIRALALAMAREEDLRIDDDALDLIVSLLGDDRGVSRAELEKLILYKGLKSQRPRPATISVEDARACLVDGVGDALDDAAAAAMDGAADRLAHALRKSAAAGASPVGLLRALSRHVARLREARVLMAGGIRAGDAMRKLRPPVFFMEQRAFEARLGKWPLEKTDAALDALLAAEAAAKQTGAPQREIAERAALKLTMIAAKR